LEIRESTPKKAACAAIDKGASPLCLSFIFRVRV
jgi:hypothetical protein